MESNKEVLLSDTKKQALIGYIIRNSRKKLDVTASGLATFAETTQQFVSRVELGIEKLSYSKLVAIFKKLGVEFDFSDEKINEAHELFLNYVHGFLNKENDYIAYVEEIINNQYKNSFAYPIYVLACFISKRYHKESVQKVCKILPAISNFLPPIERQMYHYMYSATISESRQYEKAKELIKEGLNIDTKYNDYCSQCVRGLLYYLLASVEMDFCRLLKAYQYNRIAKQIFDSQNCLQRSLNCEVLLGGIYGNMGLIKDAISVSESALKNALKLNDKSNVYVLEYNIATSYFYALDYENCIKSGLIGLENTSGYNSVGYYQLLIWSYLNLNDIKKADEYYQKFNSCSDLNETMQAWSIVFDAYINNKSNQNKLLSLENLYNVSIKEEIDTFDRIYILKQLVAYSKKFGSTKKLLEYQSLLLEMLGNFGVI